MKINLYEFLFFKSFQYLKSFQFAFARLSEAVEASEENTTVPLALTTPLNLSVTAPVVTSTSVLTVTVGDEVVSSCVTPRMFLAVKDILQKEKKPHKCALKLPYFFTSAELSSSNTDGTHNKLPLDSTRLNSLKVLVFSRFPVEYTMEKEKSWKSIKGKINGNCRPTKHIHKQAGETRDKWDLFYSLLGFCTRISWSDFRFHQRTVYTVVENWQF